MVTTKIFLMVISVVIVGIFWFAIYIPEFEKLHSDFKIYLEQEGKDQIANEVGGKLSPPFDLRESLIQQVIDTNGDYVTISSIVSGINENTQKEIFHFEQSYQVNAYSMTYKNMPGKQFAFKPGVQKQNYDFLHPLVFTDAPLVYQKTDVINGLNVYVFKSETYHTDISKSFPPYGNVKILSDANSTFWVEPITGDLIKFEKNWKAYQVKDNMIISINEIGWKKTTDYSSFILSQIAQSKIDAINYNTKIMPTLLVSLVVGINLILILRSNLKQSQENMLKNEKLTTIGNLSARISHDLRNPLFIIRNTLEVIKIKNLIKDEELSNQIEKIKRAEERMSHQIDEVLDFARERPLKIDSFSSNALIKHTLENILVPEGIKIVPSVHDVDIVGDFNQLETVLSNIIINAIYAIGDSGEIKISVESKLDSVIISIEDSGPGIPMEYMSKIFEPLFTTKSTGTGLGLPSCQSIVKRHGGEIRVKNNPTTFTIWLPKTKITP